MDQSTENNATDCETVETQAERSALGQLLDVGILNFAPDMTLTSHNSKACQLMGATPDILQTNTHYSDIISYMIAESKAPQCEEKQALIQSINKKTTDQQAGDKGEVLDIQITTLHGKPLEFRQVFRADGHFTVTIQDKAQELLRDDAIHTVMKISGTGYWYYNLQTEGFSYNNSYLKSTLEPDEVTRLQTEGPWSFFHPDDLADAKSMWLRSIRKPTGLSRQIRLQFTSIGTRWVQFTLRPRHAFTGKVIGIFCFFEDITEALDTQNALGASKEKTEKTLQSKVDFLGRLSHEIRTPLNAVIGLTDTLVQHYQDSKTLPKLQLIDDSAQHILALLNETLDHAKLEAAELKLDPQLESPAQLVNDTFQLWNHQAQKKNLRLRYHIDKTVPKEILFDSFRYEQCLNNLVSNAIKFTTQGEISVILTLFPHATEGDKLVLAVKDNGIGMTPDQQAKIFQAYVQADNSITRRYGGTGLGLCITKNIVELMGGTITLQSELGKGALFVMIIPAITIPHVAEVEDDADYAPIGLVAQILDAAKPKTNPYSHLKVLVADDNATNHFVVQSLLETVVDKIFIANNGREALDVLEIEDVDIVLMDIHMPVMDGIEATLAIRNSAKPWANIPIIALTADPEYQQQRLCMNIGMNYTLSKPVKLSNITQALDHVRETSDTAAQPFTGEQSKVA